MSINLFTADWHIYLANQAIIGSDNDACLAPSHYWNQCWLIVIWTLRNITKKYFFMDENGFENVISKILGTFNQPQCVKWQHSGFKVKTKHWLCWSFYPKTFDTLGTDHHHFCIWLKLNEACSLRSKRHIDIEANWAVARLRLCWRLLVWFLYQWDECHQPNFTYIKMIH